MKNTEAMERAPKSTELALANGEVGGLEMPADQRRRRLVRGAVAFAPVVLTLRSGGALAAASCTGVVKTNVTLGGDGQLPSGTGAVSGNYCIKTPPVIVCGDRKVIPTKLHLAPVPEYDQVTRVGSSVNLKCGNLSNGTNVAIISGSVSALQSFGING